jgi:hypothetical protein
MEIGRHLTEEARRDLYRRLVDLIGSIGEAPKNEPASQDYEQIAR